MMLINYQSVHVDGGLRATPTWFSHTHMTSNPNLLIRGDDGYKKSRKMTSIKSLLIIELVQLIRIFVISHIHNYYDILDYETTDAVIINRPTCILVYSFCNSSYSLAICSHLKYLGL